MKRFMISLWMAGMLSGLFAEDPETLSIGSRAPDFSLKGIDGQVYTLEDFKGAEVLTVVSSANHYPTAQAYEERMKDLSAADKADEMLMVAISSNHPEAVAWRSWGTLIWVSFPEEVFANMSEDDAVKKGVEILSFVLEKVESIGCTMAL